MANTKDRIWLTAKSHMIAEARYIRYDITSHIFLSYMSFLMIVATVLSDQLSAQVPHFKAINVTLAVFLFATSLIIYGFKFRDLANQHRDCYLKLQKLELNFDQEPDASTLYQEILKEHPNHSTWDYDYLILSRTLYRNETIWSGDNQITWSILMVISLLLRSILYWAIALIPPTSVTILFSRAFLGTP